MDENTTTSNTNWFALFLIVIFLLILSALVGLLLLNNQKPSSTTSTPSAAIAQGGKVNITRDGFEPETIKIKKGSQVTWTNKDSSVHIVSSDPHPTHTLIPGLGSKEMTKNQTYSFTFDKVGTFTYHDHLNPFRIKGTVVVE